MRAIDELSALQQLPSRVNTEDNRFHNPAGYGDVRTHRRGDVLHPLAFPDLDIAVDAIVP